MEHLNSVRFSTVSKLRLIISISYAEDVKNQSAIETIGLAEIPKASKTYRFISIPST